MLYLLPVAGFILALAATLFRKSKFADPVVQAVIGALLGAVITGIMAWLDGRKCCEYVFDPNVTLGWNVPNSETAREQRGGAFIGRRFSTEHAESGSGSLEVEVELIGGTRQRESDTWVIVKQVPPVGGSVGSAANLFLARVEATVYVPASLVSERAALTAGYLQLFYETCEPDSFRIDGVPGELVMGEGPIRVSFQSWDVSSHEICRIGLKMGLNDADTGAYRGRIFVSGVKWTPLTWYWQGFIMTILLLAGGATFHLLAARKRRQARSEAST